MCRWFTALLLTVLALHPGPVQALLRQPSAYVNFTPQEECADGLNEGNLYPQECAEGPYGEDWGRTGTNSIPFGWLGSHGVFHPGNGSLYLTRHRAYDTTLKRFLSSDPIGIAGGGNLYAYCRGNPLALIDPTGKCGYENRIELHMPGVNDLSYQSVGANFHNLTVNDFDIAAAVVGQVSGINSVEANYAHYGDLGIALNATYNPAYGAMSHGQEAISGYGNSYYNSGQELSTGQRVVSGAFSVVDAAATVAVAAGGASMVNSVFSAGSEASLYSYPITGRSPAGVAEQMTMRSAMEGNGSIIMEGPFGDPLYQSPGWAKMQVVGRGSDANITVHYMFNSVSGEAAQFKFVTPPVGHP